MNFRQLKKEIFEHLSAPDLQERFASIGALPPKKAVNPLFSFLYHTEPMIKWHAISAMGHVVAGLADRDLESARVIMRRMIWNLNDESGGIGWGTPEAMGESMACHKRIAEEYHRILVSYIRTDGNFLEHPELQKGLLWGLSRLASVRPELAREAGPFLLPFFESGHAEHRGLAALTAGLIQEPSALPALQSLSGDKAEIKLYWKMEFRQMPVEKLAENALKTI